MISFFVCLAILIGGYFIYGGYVESCFRPPIDDRKTPAYRLEDGVDYVPMENWRVFLIQLLNIAGLGPIFGALAGAMWGPAVFLWITFGTVFAGGVHDFISGVLSERNDGASISELCGKYLGTTMRHIMRGFSVVLLILVGVAFTTGPAGLLTKITPLSYNFWLVILLIYYFCATFLPVDKLIGKLYPFFGFCLIFMAVGVGTMLFVEGYHVPEITLTNMHPKGTPICVESERIMLTDKIGNRTGQMTVYSTMNDVEVTTEENADAKEYVNQNTGYFVTPQPIGAGVYVLAEIKAPAGYVRSKPVAYEVYSDKTSYYVDGDMYSKTDAVRYEGNLLTDINYKH